MTAKRNFLLFLTGVALGTIALFSSCDNEGNGRKDNFDRSGMLQSYATNLIIPAYTDLQNRISELQSVISTFVSNPTVTALDAVQQKWTTAYLTWQYANAYNFGPAAEQGLQKALIEEIGTFPVSRAKIDNILASGSFNLNDFNRDARGFLAVEYLIFNLQDDNVSVVQSFQSEHRRNYLIALVENIKTKVEVVLSVWNTDYKNEFARNNGTDAGSSTSLLYNEFVKSYETIKNFKIALPLGKRPGQIQPEPTLVEAYYSGKSVQMFKAHYDAIEDIWYGRRKDGTQSLGFKEYLETVEGGPALISLTEQQLAIIRDVMNNVQETPRFSQQLFSNTAALETLHNELQKNTRFFKSDMSSILGIAITYTSGDGD